jgi:hypothetical protein
MLLGIMNRAIAQNPLTFASFVTLLAGWLLLWAFVGSGANAYHGTRLAGVGAICSVCFAPLAVLLATAGLFFDRRKNVTTIALCLSVLSTFFVFSIGN